MRDDDYMGWPLLSCCCCYCVSHIDRGFITDNPSHPWNNDIDDRTEQGLDKMESGTLICGIVTDWEEWEDSGSHPYMHGVYCECSIPIGSRWSITWGGGKEEFCAPMIMFPKSRFTLWGNMFRWRTILAICPDQQEQKHWMNEYHGLVCLAGCLFLCGSRLD